MLKQISILTKVQLANFCNLNVFRHTKDKKKKYTMMGLGLVWLLLIIMVFFYVGALSYGYILLGLEQVLPMYLIAIAGLITFFLGIFKAGSVIFQKNSYDIICALPVSQTAIVVSRFFSMYIGNLLLAFCVMIPGMAVYGYLLRPGFGFYVIGFIGTLFIPLLPMTAATLFGALITAISSRMKHKSLVSAGFSVGLVLVVMAFSSAMSGMEESDFSIEMLQKLVQPLTDMIGKLYPPALWLGKAMTEGDPLSVVLYGGLYFGVSLLLFIITMAIVSVKFKTICQRLYSTSAKHNYKMEKLESSSMLIALFKKEWKRYFASSTYVSNTIVAPILMVAFAIAILAMGPEMIEEEIPLPIDVNGLMPFILAMIGCMMTTTCTSISMEGKNWWITTSLPIPAKTLFDAKILLNLVIFAPFYVVSEILLIIALKPSFMELLWLIVLPVVFILFACVYGIFINLRFPVFDWENDVTVIKQSATSLIGGLGGAVLVLISAVPVVLVSFMETVISMDLVKLVILFVVCLVTIFLYYGNTKVKLHQF